MRSYLAKFQDVAAQKISENPLPGQLTKPTELGFVGFVSTPPSTISLVFPEQTPALPDEKSSEKILSDEPTKPTELGFVGFVSTSDRGFQTESPTPTQPGACPHCHAAADLQDRQRDVWWCAGCRVFFDGLGQTIPPATVPRPLTLEQVEAEQLAADLLAAGCGFTDDEFSFQIRVPRKGIPAALIARWEAIDRRDLRRTVAQLAAEMEAAEGAGWVN